MQDYLNELGIVTWQQRTVKTLPTNTNITLMGAPLSPTATSLLHAILRYLAINPDTLAITHESTSNQNACVITHDNKTINLPHPEELLKNPLLKREVYSEIIADLKRTP